MGGAAYSIKFEAPMHPTADAGIVGDVLIQSDAPDARERYVKATAANRGTRRSDGVAMGSYVGGGSVEIARGGAKIGPDVSGLAPGLATWVRTSDLGRLERVTAPGDNDDVIGRASTDGSVHLMPGLLTPAIWAGGSPRHVVYAGDHGVAGDGELSGWTVNGTDDTAALQAAIDAAVAINGANTEQPARTLVFQNAGIVKIDGRIVINWATNVTIRGPVQLHFTGTGTEAFIKLLSANKITFEDVYFSYEDDAFEGNIIETGHGSPVTDASELAFIRCKFYSVNLGPGNSNAWSCIRFSNAIDCRVVDCNFSLAQRGVSGRNNGATPGLPDYAGFANCITITGGAFHRLSHSGIHNPGEAWTISGNNFEPITDGFGTFQSCRAIYQDDLGYFSWALDIHGNWIGDGGSSPTYAWIELKTLGLNIDGNLISGNAPDDAIKLYNCNGVSITGNRISGKITFDSSAGYTTGVLIAGNTIQSTPALDTSGIAGRYCFLANESTEAYDVLYLPLRYEPYGANFSQITHRSVTWDPGTVNNGTAVTSPDSTVQVQYLVIGMAISVGAKTAGGAGTPAGIMITASCTTNGYVRITILNMSGSNWTPGTLTFDVHGVLV